ncbi:MAG: thiopeptide-type bacteriocin biosynthesis protein, partial [Desulfobacterales bacterium]|nr:thiopeptide-type bacteriocin biosynthesis protein [Desulfobacterales bacterium]
NDEIRWLWGVKCMDLLLEQFGLSLSGKVDFFKMLNDGYSREFHMNKPMRVQLDKKYRSEAKKITNIVDLENDKNFPGLGHISECMKSARPIIHNILELSKQDKQEIPLNNLLGSLVHMHFNRLFRTKQRMHELVIYYFMHKFYKSQVARLKYSPKSEAAT